MRQDAAYNISCAGLAVLTAYIIAILTCDMSVYDIAIFLALMQRVYRERDS